MRPQIFAPAAVALIAFAGFDRPPIQQGDGWYSNPCQHDSVDSFEWTRYDLRGIRIRIPRDIRHVPYPDLNELRFQKGPARMRLRLHNDASQLFTQYEKGERGVLFCATDIAGRLAEAIRFEGPPTTGYARTVGFAARWPDADQGEWLTAVITATSMADATALRQTLFTIVFPDGRR
jgi:hypothetical protein